MKRGWMIILLLSLGLNIGLGLNLWRRGPSPAPPSALPTDANEAPDPAQIERFMRHRLDRMTDQLALDEGQQSALWNLHREVGGDVFGRRRAMMAARTRLHEAYADPDADPEVIHAAARRISTTQSYLDSMIVEVMLRERAILSPEQRRHYHSLFPIGPERFPRRLLHGKHQGARRGLRQAE